MITYVHSSVFKINAVVPPTAYDHLSEKGTRIRLASYSELFAGREEVLVSRRLSTSYEALHSNDEFPAIDICFDKSAIATLAASIFAETDVLKLSKLFYRFLDYGYLYAVAVFDFSGELFDPAVQPTTGISRSQKRLLNDLREGEHGSSLFSHFASIGLLEPLTRVVDPRTELLGPEGFDWDDNYVYGEHLFLVADLESPEVVRHRAAFEVVEKSAKFGDATVLFSDNFPIWVCTSEFDLATLLYRLEPDCLYMAESAFHSAATLAYQRLLRKFTAVDPGSLATSGIRPAPVMAAGKPSKVMSSDDLRHIIIRDKLTISTIAQRSEYYDKAQNEYLRKYKEFYPLDQGFAIYRDVEETLKYVVHDQEQKEKDETASQIEVALICFTALAFLSVVGDVDQFIGTRPATVPQPPNERLYLVIAIAVLFIAAIIYFWRKRRGRRQS